MKYNSLFPLPGGKGGKAKYALLKPLPHQTRVCEPFMGAAGISIALEMPTILGEINISQRAIAEVPSCFWKSRRYVADYQASVSEFVAGVDLDALFCFVGREKSQATLKEESRAVYDLLGDRWRVMSDRLFASVASGDPSPGLYSFCQRTCFGNVMRLNPNGTAYNVSWHIHKLLNAYRFSPDDWLDWLVSRRWSPTVLPSWQEAIEVVKRPSSCYLLLDPPYIEGDGDRKMTPCYPGHKVTGTDGRAETYSLSIDPIKVALSKGFPLIHFTNYYSPKLDADVTEMAHDAGYLCHRLDLGICAALGNSRGRYKHGDRVDAKPRPVECLWILKPFSQLDLFADGSKTPLL